MTEHIVDLNEKRNENGTRTSVFIGLLWKPAWPNYRKLSDTKSQTQSRLSKKYQYQETPVRGLHVKTGKSRDEPN